MGEPPLAIRVDYLMRICHALASNKELEDILGSPLEQHLALVVEGGRFGFHQLTPFGELEKKLSPEDESKAKALVDSILKSNYPGKEDIPGLR